jgi:phage baseplate assembly protein W
MVAGGAFYSDVDIKLEAQTDGDITRDKEYDAVINSLTNIFNTVPGSRRMLPEFALDIWRLLFEPMDEETAFRIGNEFLRAINIWDDRVTVQNIHVHANYDVNQYEVKLTFNIESRREVETIDFILKPGG